MSRRFALFAAGLPLKARRNSAFAPLVVAFGHGMASRSSMKLRTGHGTPLTRLSISYGKAAT